jgi:hypothetical protein
MKVSSFAAGLVALLAHSLHAAVSPIHMDIELSSKTKGATHKLGQADPSHGSKTQVRSLKITLSNNSSESFDNLIVKYWFLGHDMKNRDIKVLEQGQRKSSIGPRGRDVVESEVVSSSYTEQHSEVSRSKGSSRGRSRRGAGTKVTKVPASGKKLVGCAVRVLNGREVVAEYYSEDSYRDIIKTDVALKSSAAATPKAPAKKKKKK